MTKPTISGTDARAQTDRADPAEWIMPLHSAHNETAVFFVHPVGGSALPYLELSQLMGERPCYGLEAPALHGGALHATVPDIAQAHAVAIRAIHPHGRYALVGWSMGAALSFEIARALRRQGAVIALLALLDADPDWTDSPAAPDERALLAAFVADLARLRGPSSRLADPADLVPDLFRDADAAANQVEVVITRLRESRLIPAGSEPDVRRSIAVFCSLARAFVAYAPTWLDVAAILIGGRAGAPRQLAVWRALATGGVEQHVLDADHYGILRPPHVYEVAAVITAALKAVSADTRS
jgi:thioesterase domain-containing protein